MKAHYFFSVLAILSVVGTSPALLAASQATSTDRYLIRNPLIRVCLDKGGEFAAVPFGTDEIALCRFENQIIDSQTLLSSLNGIQTEAAGAVISETQARSCEVVGATSYWMPELSDYLCVFGDDSKLSLTVLLTDPNAAERIRLKDAL